MNKKIGVAIVASVIAVGVGLGGAVPANAGIQIWDHDNYNGYLGDFGRGTSNVGPDANDKATSLAVSAPAGYAELFEDAGLRGRSSGRFYTGTANLGWYNFNDITTSIG